ncbi:MAG: hypothetical protein HN413_06775 [Chloroflexi bacterium]|jgi:hypothetical protein|nr:hypothetical protein [Chloroflexota bacterium]
MHARQIDIHNPKDVRRFIQFPFDLYRDNPYWVPPMLGEMKTALDPSKHPFYQHSQAAFFIAEARGKPVARIAVLDNKRYRATSGTETGLFYYFECIDDLEAAQAVIETGAQWARQQGIRALVGPKGLAQGDSIGMLVEGFDYLPAMGIAYNMAYYPRLMDELGFTKESDLLSGQLHRDTFVLPERIHELAKRVQVRRGIHVRRFNTKDELRQFIPQVREVYNQAFATVPEFVPITEAEVWLIADKILSIADPRLIKLVFKEDALIGFMFAYPNINRALQKARGRIWPLGWWHLMREFKRTEWLDLNGIGLLPEHQGVGATAVLFSELEKTIRDERFLHGDIVQVNELNLKSFTEMDHLGVQWHKKHRVYKKLF